MLGEWGSVIGASGGLSLTTQSVRKLPTLSAGNWDCHYMVATAFYYHVCWCTIYLFTDPKVVMQYGGAKGPVHITAVQCFGNESSLLECTYGDTEGDGWGSPFGADIGVSCGEP